MIRFNQDFLENFLAVVRKYMQLRGGLTQKDLSIEFDDKTGALKSITKKQRSQEVKLAFFLYFVWKKHY